MSLWTLRTSVPADGVVRPNERLPWPQTISIGLQHVIAMFGATFLVPLLTGFPPSTTIFFSGVGTLLFLVFVKNRVPSYLGSSFALIGVVIASKGTNGNLGAALVTVFMTGLLFFLVGLVVQLAGYRWVNQLMPPLVTGVIVALIGFNLAGVAIANAELHLGYALLTVLMIVLIASLVRGFVGRVSILLGVVVVWVLVAALGGLDPKAVQGVHDAAWFGLPQFMTPEWNTENLVRGLLFGAVVVFALIAENAGHVKAVAEMTGENLDDSLGRSFMGDGFATMLAGAGGGSGTTTYAENIGVMATTRVYSTAAYVVAGVFAVLLGLVPKFGALILTLPLPVLGGVTMVLYGMIGMLGVRIIMESRVDLHKMHNIVPAAVGLIAGIGNLTWAVSDTLKFEGIATGTVLTLVLYHLMNLLNREGKAELYEDEALSPSDKERTGL